MGEKTIRRDKAEVICRCKFKGELSPRKTNSNELTPSSASK